MGLRGPSPGLRGLSLTAELHGRITKVTGPTGVPQADGPFGMAGTPPGDRTRPGPSSDWTPLMIGTLTRPERRP